LMHVVEVRSKSFVVPEFIALLREHNVAVVYADSDEHPAIADVTADFIYARLQRTREENETGYAAADLDRCAAHARVWETGSVHAGLTQIDKTAAPKTKRPVFVYMISGAKERAPAAAMALLERVRD